MNIKHLIYKSLWMIVWTIFVRPFPRQTGKKFEIILLKLFGAKIGKNCRIYSSAKIIIPYNLIMEDGAVIADRVIIQNTAIIHIKKNAIVSQGSYLCAGSHDITRKSFDYVRKPITIGENAWVAAECFVGPGVTIAEGSVLGARTVIFKDTDPWTVWVGNPAKYVKDRIMKDN